jgi:hypothetical protein
LAGFGFWRKEKGGEKIVRRILLVLAVALVMAAMMAVFSMAAVAQPSTNACEAAANQGGTNALEQTGGEFGELASTAAQAGGQEFGETIKGISSVCRQNP